MPHAAPARDMDTAESPGRGQCRGGELAGRGMAVNHVDARATAEHPSHMGIVRDFLRDVTAIDNLGITHPRAML
jgi:hypothetical protein